MKTFRSKTNYFLLSLLVILAFSCSAEDGATGPEGAQGVQGPQGAQGEQGPTGESGTGGAVSVLLESQTLVFGENEFIIPQLTKDVFDNGLVYVYISSEPESWLNLPLSQLQNIGTEEEPVFNSITILEMLGFEEGKVILFSLLDDVTVNLRIVLVSGEAAESGSFEINDFL